MKHSEHITIETGAQAQPPAADCVVVVDVWRSFTTTAYAFNAGARDILITASADEALALRSRFPEAVLMGMGKLSGKPDDGFDYGNSPAELRVCDFRDRRIILCTPNGTPGLVQSMNAQTLLAGSFVCADATVRYIKHRAPGRVTFLCTEPGVPDQPYAEYMAALLRDEKPDAARMLGEIRKAGLEQARTLVARGAFTEAQANNLEADLNCCLALDQFDFAMIVQRRDGYLVMETAHV